MISQCGKGSVILMVLIIMTALVAVVHSMLHASFYLKQLSREREIYQQKG